MAFAAKDQRHRLIYRHLIIKMFAAFIEPVDPVAGFLEILQRAGDVHDAANRHVNQRSCGGFGDRLG